MKRFKAGNINLDDEDEDDSAIDLDDDSQNANGANTQGMNGAGRTIPPVPKLPNGSA